MGQKSGPQLPMNSDAQRSKPGFGTVVRFRRVVIEHDKGGGFNRSTQHLLAVYLQESGNPMSFWDVDSSVAILGRTAPEDGRNEWQDARSIQPAVAQQKRLGLIRRFPDDPRGGLTEVFARFPLGIQMRLFHMYSKLSCHHPLVARMRAKHCSAEGALVIPGEFSFDFNGKKVWFICHAHSLRSDLSHY
jgi:hypothetical protein